MNINVLAATIAFLAIGASSASALTFLKLTDGEMLDVTTQKVAASDKLTKTVRGEDGNVYDVYTQNPQDGVVYAIPR